MSNPVPKTSHSFSREFYRGWAFFILGAGLLLSGLYYVRVSLCKAERHNHSLLKDIEQVVIRNAAVDNLLSAGVNSQLLIDDLRLFKKEMEGILERYKEDVLSDKWARVVSFYNALDQSYSRLIGGPGGRALLEESHYAVNQSNFVQSMEILRKNLLIRRDAQRRLLLKIIYALALGAAAGAVGSFYYFWMFFKVVQDWEEDTQRQYQEGARVMKAAQEGRAELERLIEARAKEFQDQQKVTWNILEDIQEEKKEIELKDKQISLLAKFADENPFPVVRLSHGMDILYKNKASEGFLKDLGGSGNVVFSEELTQNIRLALLGRGKHAFELLLASRVFFIYVITIPDVDFFYLYAQDITELRKADERIKILSRAVEQNPNLVVVTDTQGTIEYVNPRFSEITGYSSDEAIGKNPRILQSGYQTKEFYQEMWRSLAAGEQWRGEIMNKTKSGAFYWASLVVSGVKNEKGETTHFVGVQEDITKRKESERDVTRLATALEACGDIIIITDNNGIIQYVNMAFERITGYQRKEVVGEKISILKSGKQDNEFYQRLWETILKGDTWRGVLVNKKKDGNLFEVELTITPIGENSQIVNYVAVERDVTERQANERRLRSMLDALQKAHNEVREIQDQLLQSEKMASIGQLAAGIAHEINNPVGFISSNIQTFQQYMGKVQKYIDKIKAVQSSMKAGDVQACQQGMAELENLEGEINLPFIVRDINTMLKESVGGVDRIVKIVNDLRNFSRVDDGSINYANVHEAIDMSINIVWNEIKYKVELKKSYGDLPPVKCNPQKLGQVIMNLLINATQAMKERGVVEIKTYRDKAHAYIEVSDTGEGIPEENLKKIFDPFFTTKPVGKGTGLGLSVSYDIIKKHGGEISVASVVGKGTTFTIKLPI